MIEHLYVHIPFCHRICPYCSFYKHTPGNVAMADFVKCLLLELEASPHPIQPQTIYLGGGTPTALSEPHLEALLSGLKRVLDFSTLQEFSCEINPRTVNAQKAAVLRAGGVTRASLGVQAWDKATLHTLGRDHSPAEAEATFQTLRRAGFESVSLDLMFSIPGQSLEVWEKTLDETLRLQPDHISAYNLNYEEDTEFFERLRAGKYRVEEERDAAFFQRAMEKLEAVGYEHYEISNYARPGHQSVHNRSYWLGEDYLGLGPSAFSTVNGCRWQNVADTQSYLQRLLAGESAAQAPEVLTAENRRTERFGLELRTARGLPVEMIQESERAMLTTLAKEGLLKIEQAHVRLTQAGKPLVDSIALALLG